MLNIKLHSSVIIDSSSIIYLNQTGILNIFLQNVKTYSTRNVREEVTYKNASLEILFLSGLIDIITPENVKIMNNKMSKTDRELVEISLVKNIPVLTDDGEISRYCDIFEIPHLNSLTAVILLYEKDVIELNDAYESLNVIAEIGRYSKEIVSFAFSLLP